MFDTYATVVILFAFTVISLIIIFDAPLRFTFLTNLFKKKELDEEEDKTPELMIANASELGISQKDLKEIQQAEPRVAPPVVKKEEEPKKDEFGISPLLWNGKEFTPPPLSLLSQDKGKPGVGDIKSNSNIIKRTLQNFGINVEMDEISIGPSITRYALKPAEGVKLSRILALQNDLSLALAAHIITPITYIGRTTKRGKPLFI
jgi:S-DNA-T family DNA segregation ATPase FtsK/SpoIIIE